jgi:hypothetical protein
MNHLHSATHWSATTLISLLCVLTMGCGGRTTTQPDTSNSHGTDIRNTEPANPKLMLCPACGREIAKAALACPHCGQPSPLEEKKRREFEAVWSKDPIVGRDIVSASRCDIENGEVVCLAFSANAPLENDGLRHISGLRKLWYLELHSAKVTDEGLNRLAGLKDLSSLDLIGCSITPDGIAKLTQFGELTCLSLDEEQATVEGLSRIKGLSKLERLTLAGQHISDAVLNILAGFPKLRYLYLDQSGASAAGLKRLREAKKDLKILNRHTYREL